jgi:hypothetical protein
VTKCSFGEVEVHSSPTSFYKILPLYFMLPQRTDDTGIINKVGDLVSRPEENSWYEFLPLREFAE